MIKWKNNYYRVLIIILITALIPILIITYKIIFTDKTAVTFTFDSPLGFILLLYYILLIIGVVFAFTYWLVKQIKAIIQLKEERTKAELMHLKTQVSPHFFFNMLNNLYGWIDKDTDKAKELVLKLSDMMRYSIYDGEKESVTLNEEIDFVNNFIELHKMRYHKKIDVTFDIDVKDGNIKVMPLLFVILLENAFKHGVETLRKNSFVHLKIQSNNQEVFFEVKNNFEQQAKNEEGIGLRNLKRRLELVYPKTHKLSCSQEGDIYTAQLTLKNNR